jgi:hypothetical protein
MTDEELAAIGVFPPADKGHKPAEADEPDFPRSGVTRRARSTVNRVNFSSAQILSCTAPPGSGAVRFANVRASPTAPPIRCAAAGRLER